MRVEIRQIVGFMRDFDDVALVPEVAGPTSLASVGMHVAGDDRAAGARDAREFSKTMRRVAQAKSANREIGDAVGEGKRVYIGEGWRKTILPQHLEAKINCEDVSPTDGTILRPVASTGGGIDNRGS